MHCLKSTWYSNLFCLIIISAIFSCQSEIITDQATKMPAPTNTLIHQSGEDGDSQLERQEWFERMHRAAPGTNWKTIEKNTAFDRNRWRQQMRPNGINSRGGELESIANGKLTGTWKERGSLNQSGSVRDTEYDPVVDSIWLIADGGTLYRGARDGSHWEVINQNIQFDHGLLKFIPTDEGRRLLGLIAGVPHYSDDDGLSWTASTGITADDNWGGAGNIEVLSDNTIVCLSKPSYWDDLGIYKSTDNGVTFELVVQLNSNFRSDFVLEKPHHTDELYFVDKTNSTFNLLYLDDGLEPFSTLDDFAYGDAPANLAATKVDDVVIFYAYNGDNEVYQTNDVGATWTYRGQMNATPWSVGIYVSPSDPNKLFMGEVNSYRSTDGGQNWILVNEWWEYYDFPVTKLHADIMYFGEYQTADGEDFLLISNHGGLSISYSDMIENENIGLEGLNVSQYYSVRTSPIAPYITFAGSQDQGFQKGDVFDVDIANFDQIISGDYGHIVFSKNGQDLWTVYPGGSVSFYRQAILGNLTEWYEVESDHESVWLPPLMENPIGSESSIYMAGGNIEGGEGSYMIKLTAENNNTISASQFDFDFRSNAGNDGELSAMGYSPLNSEKLYAATTNGRFFYSNDGGDSWEQTINFVNSGHWLYGQSIYASKLDEDVVYLGGSGYSNAPVFRSTDGGNFFTSFSQGLPSTLVFDITANEDETMLFAATEAGPYVYIFEEEQWFDLSGLCAPTQTYWSVEYLPLFNTVRFGTYGRGIWDFEIESFTNTQQVANAETNLKIYPNPSSGIINVELPENHSFETATVYNIEGKEVFAQQVKQQNDPLQFDLSQLATGRYVVTFVGQEEVKSQVFQIQR